MRSVSRVVLAVVLALGVSSRVQAAYDADYTGNSLFSTGSGLSLLAGYVNFAVYYNPSPGTAWRTDAGVPAATTISSLGTSASALTASSVVFFQITRNDSEPGSLALLQLFDLPAIAAPGTPWIGGGMLTDTVFVSGTDVQGLEPTGLLHTLGTPGTPVTTGVAAPTYNSTSGPAVEFAVDAISLDLTGGASGGPQFNFGSGTAGIQDGVHSVVLFLATNWPEFQISEGGGLVTSDLGASASFSAPVATPEPGSLLLLSVGLIGGVVGAAWKRRRKQAVESPAAPPAI